MQIRLGYDIVYSCTQPTPMILTLNIHASRVSDLIMPDYIHTDPSLPLSAYRDSFGNWVTRIVLPEGDTRIYTETVINDSGEPDKISPEAQQFPVETLPEETLMYLLGSRYCETDILSEEAWRLFGDGPTGWQRVQAICEFVHNHIQFGYEHADATKTAAQVYQDGIGVCRDYTHLAVTFCRCMNIPARYCTGYLSDIGEPVKLEQMDFAAWFEAYLEGEWHTFDPRNNRRLKGRVLIAQGRDAADVAISNSFGFNILKSFDVQVEEVK